jgi:hypothetical protein
MARDVILPPFAMKSCANPCRARAQQPLLAAVALSLVSLGGNACAAEREDFTEPALAEMSLAPLSDPAPFADCEQALRARYDGAHYDGRLILQCSDADCAGAEWSEAEGHRVVNALTSLSLLVVDVGSADEVLGWACRYTLDPAYHGAFSEGFPNLTLDLKR